MGYPKPIDTIRNYPFKTQAQLLPHPLPFITWWLRNTHLCHHSSCLMLYSYQISLTLLFTFARMIKSLSAGSASGYILPYKYTTLLTQQCVYLCFLGPPTHTSLACMSSLIHLSKWGPFSFSICCFRTSKYHSSINSFLLFFLPFLVSSCKVFFFCVHSGFTLFSIKILQENSFMILRVLSRTILLYIVDSIPVVPLLAQSPKLIPLI